MKREEIQYLEKNNIPVTKVVTKVKKNVTEKLPNKTAKMTHSKMTHTTKPSLGLKGKIEKKGGKKKLPKPTEKPSFGLSSFLKKF